MNRKRAWMMGAVVTALACGGPLAQAKDKPTPPEIYAGTQIGQGPCVSEAQEAFFLAPILSAILGTAISNGVNKIGAALKTAGDEKTWKVTSNRNLDITAAEFAAGPCIQIVRGKLFTSSPPAGRLPTDIDDERVRKGWQILARNGVYVAGQPDFFFEGKISTSQSGKALTIAPLYARMDAPVGSRAFRSDDSRQVAIFLTYFDPDDAALVTADNAAAALVLGELKPKVGRDFKAPVPPLAGGPATGPLGEDLLKPIKPADWVRPPNEAAWFNLALPETRQPLTLGALVTETQDANAFLKFVGGVLGDEAVTEATATALKSKIDPAERKKAREAAATAALALRDEYETALIAAVQKTAACQASPGVDAAGEARIAIRTLITKASAMQFPPVLAESDATAIRLTDSPANIKVACQMAAAKVTALGSAHP